MFMFKNKYSATERLMLKLSFIAYVSLFGSDEAIKDAIEKALRKITPDQKLVWGPAIGHKKPESDKRPNYALMYIVQDSKKANEYTVVVRGTNPFSLVSWLEQDLNVRRKVLWTKESQHSSAKDAWISAATYRSLQIHKNLLYPDNSPQGKTFFDYLKTQLLQGEQLTINFTGHSLGGLMAPTLALWFYDMLGTKELIKYREQTGINVYAFAGPTAGDINFASYSDSILLPPKSMPPPRSSKCCTRYINEADIAVNVWHKDGMRKISSFYGQTAPISALISRVLRFLSGMVKNMKYAQLTNMKIVAEYNETLAMPSLDDLDLEEELGLKDSFPLYALYKKGLLGFGINEEEIERDIKETLVWLLMAVYHHVLPYIFNILPNKHEQRLILDEVIFPLIEDTYPGAKIKKMLKNL